MTKFLLYSFLAILAFISVQVQSAVLPVSKEVALVETSTSSESSSTTIDTLGSSRVKRQGGCGCCGCGGGCGCCGCGGGGGGGCGCCCCRPKCCCCCRRCCTCCMSRNKLANNYSTTSFN
uniref:Uncharacterized protein n=1 Tax=Caenorhabditis japonica TaxID=281687 RepID=A0A8R1EPX5_CAEJA